MKKLRRRLFLSMIMLVFTAVTLTSTTYAWFMNNRNLDADPFEFDIQSAEGLLVGVKGIDSNGNHPMILDEPSDMIYYGQNLSTATILTAIQDSTGLENMTMSDGVTLNIDNTGELQYKDDVKPVFQKDSLERVGDTDYYTHELVEAQGNEYIQFQLYFRIVTNGTERKTYELRTTNYSSITSNLTDEEAEVVLLNDANGCRKDGLNQMFKAGAKINIDPVNAMRIAFTAEDKSTVNGAEVITPSTYVYNTTVPGVYEGAHDLGGTAIAGYSVGGIPVDPYYFSGFNLALTYYNNTHPLSKFDLETCGAYDCAYSKAENRLGDYNEDCLGTFVYSESAQDYNEVRVTVTMWIEGWDSDFIMGIPLSKLTAKLGFGIVEV